MSQAQGEALAVVLLALAAAGYIAWRIAVGSSFFHPPPMRVFRASDPFSFWLSLLPPAIFVILVGAGALHLLLSSI